MGSLTSRPKMPQQQPQVIYVPSPVTTVSTPAPVSSTFSGGTTSPQPAEKTPEQRESEAREQNLLTRERGRFGTINTSFRGLLGLAGQGGGQSKTLLGE